ncbi:glycosyltransferase [Flavobacteriaceae bacterium 14752]|uniref:glycosyltransferase n=1 Tax=Mesohalobacter salilacus TaxID=2491711 RepID=UPI000F642652|nr:glycosyltransferase family 2 protein [Flavobacteriaceae bacterium 14752]
MRKGTNPAKNIDNKVKTDDFHQVIVPVYLPNLEGYYKEGLDILKLCLESIVLTSHNKTYISVVNNGSCVEVKAYLNELLQVGKIHEVIHTTAIGKINAIAKGLAGHNFDLVTITDADVLFINGWQKAVYEIYETFPRAGMVGTTPQPMLFKTYNEKIFFDNFFNPNFKFYNVNQELKEDIKKMYSTTIGLNHPKSKYHFKKILAISKKNLKSVVGNGHFTATYKSELLKYLKNLTAKEKMGGSGLNVSLDEPSVKHGHWRLCTFKNYTYHMGNIKESWMDKKINLIKTQSKSFDLKQPQFKAYKSSLPVSFIRGLVRKFFIRTFLFKDFLTKKGLTRKEAEIY